MSKLKGRLQVRHMNSFFQEIVIVILFFSLSCAIIIQVFAKSFLLNQDSDKRNLGLLTVSSFCETFSIVGDLEETIDFVFGSSAVLFIEEDKATIPMNDKFEVSEDGAISFEVFTRSTKTPSGEMLYADVSITENGERLFALTTSSYQTNGGKLND